MEGILGPDVAKDLGFGGALGFLLGFTLKRVFKMFLLLAGLYVLSLIWLADKGVILVKWQEVEGFASGLFTSFSSFARGIVGTLPFGGGFALGFAIGIKV